MARSLFLHSFPIGGLPRKAGLSCREPFAIVALLLNTGEHVQPIGVDVPYLLAGGLQGLPYAAELPPAGSVGYSAPLAYYFDANGNKLTVTGERLILATYSDIPPEVNF